MDDIKNLTLEALIKLRDEKMERFNELRKLDAPSDDDKIEAVKLGTDLKTIFAEVEVKEAAQTELDDEFKALKDVSFEPEKKAEPKADDKAKETKTEEKAPEVKVEDPAPVEPVEPEVKVETPEPVAAKTKGVAELAAKSKKPEAPAVIRHKPLTITAAADVPDFGAGQKLDLVDVGQAVINRAQSFAAPSGDGSGAPDIRRFGTAKFGIDYADDVMVALDSPMEVVEAAMKIATDESQLPGGSLVAAGSWCAPSETVYEIEGDTTADGMYSLPEVGVRRGGMRWPIVPDFASFYANPGFKFTEAQTIAGVTKPCIEVNCPTWDEARLGVEGVCIKVPILTNVGYPEYVKFFVAETLMAHQHWMNADVIGQVVAKLGAARVFTGFGSTVSDTLEAIELTIVQRRQKHRLALNASMEVVLPHWIKAALRSDLGRRSGRVGKAVSDAEIASHFASISANVQYIYDWQSIDESAEAYPATFQVAVYPAGTFVKGVQPVITLDTIYDAASLQSNIYTGLFTEQGYLVARKKLGGDLLTLPVCNAGRVGAHDLTCAV